MKFSIIYNHIIKHYLNILLKNYLKIVLLSLKFPLYYKNWWIAYLDYFKVLKKLNINEILYEFRTGEKLYARPKQFDIGIINEVFISKVYEQPQKDIIIRNADIVIDAGGYIGDFSVYAAKRAINGNIYTFEPSSDNYSLIKKNVKLNKLLNVIVYNKGLFKESEKKIFYLNKKALGSSSLFEVESSNEEYKKQIIKTIGINRFLTISNIKKVDFLKLDCEGAEYDIIYSLFKNILKNIRCIVIEYHEYLDIKGKMYTKKELIKYLKKFGFTVYTDLDGYLFCRNKFIK